MICTDLIGTVNSRSPRDTGADQAQSLPGPRATCPEVVPGIARRELRTGPFRRWPSANRSLALTLLLHAVSFNLAAADVRDIELRRLFEPTPAELRAEQSGRIYIYDGLQTADVARALDEEFDRVESMMFVRTKKTENPRPEAKASATGSSGSDDDGC